MVDKIKYLNLEIICKISNLEWVRNTTQLQNQPPAWKSPLTVTFKINAGLLTLSTLTVVSGAGGLQGP